MRTIQKDQKLHINENTKKVYECEIVCKLLVKEEMKSSGRMKIFEVHTFM